MSFTDLIVKYFKFCFVIICYFTNYEVGYSNIYSDLNNYDKTNAIGFEIIENNKSGLSFKNELNITAAENNQVLLNGSGVTSGDYDKDGLLDIYFCGIESNNSLYKNLGNFKFENVSKGSELECSEYRSTTCAFADLNGDGFLDLVVGTLGEGIILFFNQKNGEFFRKKIQLPFSKSIGIYGTPITDIDQDGDLDIYLSTYRSTSIRNSPNLKFELGFSDNQQTLESAIDTKTGEKFSKERFYISDGKVLEAGTKDFLLLNDGSGQFEVIALADFKATPNEKVVTKMNWGLGSIFADFNNDYRDDLYVCNDLDGEDFFYYFTREGIVDALLEINQITPAFSMGVDVADINNDGLSDFIVVDMLNTSLTARKMQIPHDIPKRKATDETPREYRRNMLFTGSGSGKFNEIAHYSGLESTDWSWCPIFLDVDLDGFQDLLVTNGFSYDLENPDVQKDLTQATLNEGGRGGLVERTFKLEHSKLDFNQAYRNQGNLKFSDYSTKWNFNQKGISHGACLADLDNDGDLDVVVNNFSLYLPERELLGKHLPRLYQSSPECSIYENKAVRERIKVRVRLKDGNTHGIGATIVFIQDAVRQSNQIRTGSRYCSSDNPEVTFAWLPDKSTRRIECHLNGNVAVIENLKANTLITFRDSDFAKRKNGVKSGSLNMFVEQPINKSFRHAPSQLNAQHFQPSVNRNHYTVEPVISSIVAAGDDSNVLRINRGGIVQMVNIEGDKNRRRQRSNQSRWDIIDFTHLIVGDKMIRLELQRQLNSKQQFTTQLTIIDDESNPRSAKWNHPLPANYNCLAITKKNGQTDTALIAFGGGTALGQYPLATQSLILELRLANPGEKPRIAHKLPGDKPVNDLVFADLDGQAGQELVIAPDGEKITVYRINNKATENITQALGLESGVGNWNSIACGDLNGNGENDLFAANWGTNQALNRYIQYNYRMYFSKENGIMDIFETFQSNDKNILKPSLAKFKKSNPIRGLMYSTHESFRLEGVENIFNNAPNFREINQLQTRLFLNNNASFKAHPLPSEVQFAPTFGVVFDDFNLDGLLDIALNQGFNDYYDGTEPQLNNSNLILINRMDDKKSFDIAYKTGLGKNRSFPRVLASGDYNGDNQPDLAIPEYNGYLRYFVNQASRSGIKLILGGDSLARIGTKARLLYKDGSKGATYEYISKYGYRKEAPNYFIFGYNKPVTAIEIIEDSATHTLGIKPGRSSYTWK